MVRNVAIGTVVVFVIWAALDWVVHDILLAQLYMETKQLWRPHAEMKIGVYFVSLILTAAAFTTVYVKLISDKSRRNGLLYGAILGFGWAVSYGYGNYSFMPIPYELALFWFLSIWFEVIVAGAALGFVVRE